MRALAPSKNEVLSTNTTPSAEPSPNSSTSPCWIGASSASVTRVPSTRVATAVPSKSVTRPMATSADAAVWANWPGASGPATRATTSPSSLSPSRVVRPAGSADAKKVAHHDGGVARALDDRVMALARERGPGQRGIDRQGQD